MGDNFTVEIQPSHIGYDENDDGWAKQKAAFLQQLRALDDVESVERVERAVESARGGPAEVIMTLSSTGAIAAIASVVKTWILRDKGRKVKLVVRKGELVFDLEGDRLDEALVQKVATSLARE